MLLVPAALQRLRHPNVARPIRDFDIPSLRHFDPLKLQNSLIGLVSLFCRLIGPIPFQPRDHLSGATPSGSTGTASIRNRNPEHPNETRTGSGVDLCRSSQALLGTSAPSGGGGHIINAVDRAGFRKLAVIPATRQRAARLVKRVAEQDESSASSGEAGEKGTSSSTGPAAGPYVRVNAAWRRCCRPAPALGGT